jgi:hypothetical protein
MKMGAPIKEEIDICHRLIDEWYAANFQFNPDWKEK